MALLFARNAVPSKAFSRAQRDIMSYDWTQVCTFDKAEALWYNQHLRIWELECRREPALSFAKADLRPHSSEFSQVLIMHKMSGVADALAAFAQRRRAIDE